jgi:PIN domain nuclease of toxin-antitoxin system
VILLDTHVAIWAAEDDSKLGRQSRSLITAARAAGTLAVSAISAWEIALLVSKQRLALTASADLLWGSLLDAGVKELPITSPVAFLSVTLELHGDPADRFIAATAIQYGAALMTADKPLLRWRHSMKRHDASK